MSLIEVAGLTHSYSEREVLQDLNLSIGRGEVFTPEPVKQRSCVL
jgi:ABC-type transporter Mla maintaining outer membrane lipid asymmetry ATPase subunit MlaF